MSETCHSCGREYGHRDDCVWLAAEIERETTGELIKRLTRERDVAVAQVERLLAAIKADQNG